MVCLIFCLYYVFFIYLTTIKKSNVTTAKEAILILPKLSMPYNAFCPSKICNRLINPQAVSIGLCTVSVKMMFSSCQNTFFLILTEGIITHISHPAKVSLVVLRLEPTAQSLGGWSYAPSPLRRSFVPTTTYLGIIKQTSH